MGFKCRIPRVKPLLNNKQCWKRHTWDKEKKTWSVAQRLKVFFSDESKFCICVKFLQSVLIWGAMSSAGVTPLCFIMSRVNTVIYQDILEHFMLPSADKLYGDADYIFQQDLAPAHSAKSTKTCFNDHGVTVLDWPANLPDLNPIENLWGIAKRTMRDRRPNNPEELKAAIEASWSSITPYTFLYLIFFFFLY